MNNDVAYTILAQETVFAVFPAYVFYEKSRSPPGSCGCGIKIVTLPV